MVIYKTYNTDSSDITITFTDQNGKPLGIVDKVDFTLLINKYRWHFVL